MPKNMNVDNTQPVDKSSYGPGTRGESAEARTHSGNHFGNRARGPRGSRGSKMGRVPKSS